VVAIVLVVLWANVRIRMKRFRVHFYKGRHSNRPVL
jgi:hypothetical protein